MKLLPVETISPSSSGQRKKHQEDDEDGIAKLRELSASASVTEALLQPN